MEVFVSLRRRLGQQLVAVARLVVGVAGGHNGRVVRVWMRFAVGLLAAAALVGGGLAGAQAAGGLGHYDPHGQKLEAELSRLLNSASQYVDQHYPECRVPCQELGAPAAAWTAGSCVVGDVGDFAPSGWAR